MQTYDLALYGHITIDQMINENFQKSYSLGAMANVWSALKQLDSNLNVCILEKASEIGAYI